MRKTILSVILLFLFLIFAFQCFSLPGMNKTFAYYNGDEIVKTAKKYLGVPYLSGGDNPAIGFNSSGFVRYVFLEAAQIELPRSSGEQFSWGTSISANSLKPGDVLFFNDSTGKINNSAIYIGNDQMILSLQSKGVAISGFKSSAFWYPRYVGAKRITSEPAIDMSNMIVAEAYKHLGIQYAYGEEDPKTGFDSSGFIQYVFKKAVEIQLPRTLNELWKMGDSISQKNVKPGDVIFFKESDTGKINQAAIYAGNDRIIHPTKSQGVTITGFTSNTYWNARYAGIKRITSEPAIDMSNPIVAEAYKYLGTSYIFGGEDPNTGFDCSGLVQYVFKKAINVDLPRTTIKQWGVGTPIEKSKLKPGDVLFFSNTYREGISHVGIYIGGNRFIHAHNPNGVIITYLSDSYYLEKYTGARRYDK